MEPKRKLLAFVLALETSLFAGALALAEGGLALADDGPRGAPLTSLQWVRDDGAGGCIDAKELSRRVEEKLRRPVWSVPQAAELLVEGVARQKPGGFRAELKTFDAEGRPLGTREVVSERETCEELSETVAVVLAVMIDPAGALNPPSDPTPTAQEVPAPEPVISPADALVAAPACPPPSPVLPPAAPPPPKLRPMSELSAFGRVTYGHVPEVMGGGGVAFALRFTRWGGVRIEGVAMAEHAVNEQGPAGTGADVRALYAGAAYCPLWLMQGRWQAAACAGVAAGVLQSAGFGFDQGRASQSPLVDAVVEGRSVLTLFRGLGLAMGAGLLIPLSRTSFEGTSRSGLPVALFEQPTVGGRFDLGLSVRLGDY